MSPGFRIIKKGKSLGRTGILTIILVLLFFGVISGSALAMGKHEGSHGNQHESSHDHGVPADGQQSATVELKDIELLDQEGRSIKLKKDVIGKNIVVMNFMYTTCTTQCPLNSQILAHVQKNLSEQDRERVRIVSLSIDPGTDTPQRLKEFAEKVGAGPGWTWLTGHKPDVDRLLNALGVYAPDFSKHPSVILVGDGKTGKWTRFYNQPAPDQLLAAIHKLTELRKQVEVPLPADSKKMQADAQDAAEKHSKARAYFTELPLITHDGRKVRFYSDLLKDKIVLINLFFSNCEKSCPMVHDKLAKLQKLLDGYMGESVFFISMTIDPGPDTPEILKKYAENFHPQEGWTFVTGNPEDIRTITYKLGQISEDIEAHSPFLMVGDVNRVRWKKFLPNVTNEMLARFIRMLASDHPSS